ncbi:MAG TPA: hypothetical protein VHE78_15075 [Gemmatimonadaceae bacterium]|nr:hypothetical protein [Gemmatimonadaceae bacterium]
MSPGAVVQALLEGLIDYAGLFPPASLPMTDAVRNYAGYRQGAHAWVLGRFVVPVARLDELTDCAAPVLGHGAPWRLSALGGAPDVDAIAGFNARNGTRALVDTVEAKAQTVEEIEALTSCVEPLGAGGAVYVETPIACDPDDLVRAIKRCGLRAKVRTGGVTTGAFPTSAELVRFLRSCAVHGVAFKATAGLHHALRGTYPLTDDPRAECGTMFGFLNVFLAAAVARSSPGTLDATALLEEGDARALAFDEGGVTWRGRRLDADAVRAARAEFATSFGSCSIAEPLQELGAMGLL